jgi:hypothetical protein
MVQTNQLKEDAEKLTTMSKFEISAIINGGTFDRGDNRVACMKELNTLRNDYVHPKVRNIPIEISEISETESHYIVEMELSGKHLKCLVIDRISKFWFPKDAVSVVAKCTEFYNLVIHKAEVKIFCRL